MNMTAWHRKTCTLPSLFSDANRDFRVRGAYRLYAGGEPGMPCGCSFRSQGESCQSCLQNSLDKMDTVYRQTLHHWPCAGWIYRSYVSLLVISCVVCGCGLALEWPDKRLWMKEQRVWKQNKENAKLRRHFPCRFHHTCQSLLYLGWLVYSRNRGCLANFLRELRPWLLLHTERVVCKKRRCTFWRVNLELLLQESFKTLQHYRQN